VSFIVVVVVEMKGRTPLCVVAGNLHGGEIGHAKDINKPYKPS
jgi:hypothetical protein